MIINLFYIWDDKHQYKTQLISLLMQFYYQSIFCCTRIIFLRKKIPYDNSELKKQLNVECHISTISLTNWTQWKLVHFTGHDDISCHNMSSWTSNTISSCRLVAFFNKQYSINCFSFRFHTRLMFKNSKGILHLFLHLKPNLSMISQCIILKISLIW